MNFKPLSQDLTIFNKLNLEKQPVGVKFMYYKPEGIGQLDKQLALCEMFKEAQVRENPFYITKENENCVGKLPLGWDKLPEWAESGQIGDRFEIFQEPRANQRLYKHFYLFNEGVVNYVAFSRLDVLPFEPDILMLMAKPSQAEIVLRAMSYSTGELWQPKSTPVLGCSWLYTYPFQSGNVNYTITGMNFGMKARQVFPEGYVIISIPYNWIPVIANNLKEMKWVLPAYALGREEWMKYESKTYEELANE